VAKGKTKGDYWGQIHSDQMVLGKSDVEAGLREQWPKKLRKAKCQGGLPALNPFRSDDFHGSLAGRLDRVSGGQKNSSV
jgi:hypothetical protein